MDLNLKYIEVKNVQIYSGREVDFHLSYQNFGQDINQFPVVVVNHSLTGNSNVSGQNGWWKDLIGKNKLIDTDRFAVLAFIAKLNPINTQRKKKQKQETTKFPFL